MIDETWAKVNKYYRGANGITHASLNGTVSYYQRDAHGDVTALTDSTGVITKSYLYDAFGVEQNASSTDNNPFRYCGEYFDDETDMTYLRNRYYNSSIGRFVSEDPIKDGWNWYVYCGNNPVNYQDSTGYIREPGYNKNGEWSSNPDWDDYGDIPYVYDSLETLGNNWLVATADQRLSIKALADFVRTVGDDFRTGIRAWTFGGVLDKQRISSTEKIVAIANPLGALNVDNAQEIAWTEVQSRYGADIPPGSLDGSNANAFLHCYWNALITKKIGSYWAKLFTDAHEYGINNNLGLNAQMDLFNNSVGIYIGENIENKDNAHIANTVQNYVNYGWLLRNKVNGVVQNINIPTNSDYR